MRVYIVRKICDYEYGCRDVEVVFSTRKKAEEFVENSPYNQMYEFWDGSSEPNLIIEEYEVVE